MKILIDTSFDVNKKSLIRFDVNTRRHRDVRLTKRRDGVAVQPDFRKNAVLKPKGNHFEAFELGRQFTHHWGRTVRQSEATLFSTLTLNFNPLHFNREYAIALGHPETPVNPLLVFTLVLGLSVEDLSEAGGAFLGVDDLEYGASVYPDDTLTARSTVKALRNSSSNAMMGIATWHTEGFNQNGERVISFLRTNMVARERAAA